jgi:hypothetical protein
MGNLTESPRKLQGLESPIAGNAIVSIRRLNVANQPGLGASRTAFIPDFHKTSICGFFELKRGLRI